MHPKERENILSASRQVKDGAKRVNDIYTHLKQKVLDNTTPEDVMIIGTCGFLLTTQGAINPEALPPFVNSTFASIRERPFPLSNYGSGAGILFFADLARYGHKRFKQEHRLDYWKIVGRSVVADIKTTAGSIQRIPKVLQRG